MTPIRPLTSLFVALAVFAGEGARCEPDPDLPLRNLAAQYRRSPIELRRELIRAASEGRLKDWPRGRIARETDDHSYDDLLIRHPRIRTLLASQIQARRRWKSGRLHTALREFETLAARFRKLGARTEAAFCYYTASEICAEREQYRECLDYLARAGTLIDFGRSPYLEAHYFEGLGYALWFLDDLPTSIQAFSQAVKRWQHIRFVPGIVACWNNMASLYEEIQLFRQAETCYETALRKAESSDLEELGLAVIERKVRINFALLARKRGHRKFAAQLIAGCGSESETEQIELDLARARIFDDLTLCDRIRPRRPSQRIERDLLRSELLIGRKQYQEAEIAVRTALETSRQFQLAYYGRKSLHQLGLCAELQGNFRKAIEYYSRASRIRALHSQPSFPFSRIYSTSLNGWVRCLVRLGRTAQARRLIQHHVVPPEKTGNGETGRTGIDLGAPPPEGHFKGRHPSPRPDSDFTVIELWPDGNRIYVWVEDGRLTQFICLYLSEPAGRMILDTLSPYYRANQALPANPDSRRLQRLKKELLAPLAGRVETRRIVIVPHKILQVFPFELLTSTGPTDAASNWIISYLPAFDRRFEMLNDPDGPPVVLIPGNPQDRKGTALELDFFTRHFPESAIHTHFSGIEGRRARWIHLSGHLEWNPFFWKASQLGGSGDDFRIQNLLRKDFHCSLLSLGVCDAGNGYDGVTPYWLGFSEGFLFSGADALLVSRWKLDDLSSQIFLGFFRRVRLGVPMDRALFEARREFKRFILHRGRMKQSAGHPFFWAGVSYVGWPNRKLYPAASGSIAWSTLAASAVLLLLASTVVRKRSKAGGNPPTSGFFSIPVPEE